MWQIQWLLALLPVGAWYVLLVLGIAAVVASIFLKIVPLISQYSLPIKWSGIAVIVLSTWMLGGFANEEKWKARVAELEAKVLVAEAKSAKINTVIETVYVDRVKVVTDTRVALQNTIRKSANKLDQTCRIPEQAITILNQSAGNPGDVK